MKRYYTEYERDKSNGGSDRHIWGFASSLKTAKGYIRRCRREEAEYNPRNFRIYDTWADVPADQHVPCVYSEQ